jgi:RimJ/RimL family protein N-acetyltransferase
MHGQNLPPIIETERLLLRAWRDSDREPWATMNANPRVREFFPGTLDRQGSDTLLGHLNARITKYGFGFWALEDRASGKFLGFTGLAHATFPAPFTPCVEIGWRLAHRYWGKGYAFEAALAALDHGFGKLGLASILSFAAAQNSRSRKVMERIGMRHDPNRDFPHPSLPPDHPMQPHVLYRIAAADHLTRSHRTTHKETL